MVESLVKEPEVSVHEETKSTKDGGETREDLAKRSKESAKRRKAWKITGLGIGLFSLIVTLSAVLAVVLSRRENGTPKAGLAIDKNFPDPGFVYFDKTWYAFATNSIVNDLGVVFRVPIAVSSDFKHWNVTDEDALPTVADWETVKDHWAPDVIQRVSRPTIIVSTDYLTFSYYVQDDGKFILHYSGEAKAFFRHHCVGVAISVDNDPLGPYVPEPDPLACHLDDGGAIDSVGFIDSDGTPYALYKVDGNSVGNGGECNNAIEPIISTPIMLQKLKKDQVTTDGKPIEIFDREETDGPLVEAPHLVKSKEDIYFLFFSSHCFTSIRYNVNYATAKSIKGPYKRAKRPLLRTGDFDLISPGGAAVSQDGSKILFHGNCSAGRCMYAGNVTLNGTYASVDLVKEGFIT